MLTEIIQLYFWNNQYSSLEQFSSYLEQLILRLTYERWRSCVLKPKRLHVEPARQGQEEEDRNLHGRIEEEEDRITHGPTLSVNGLYFSSWARSWTGRKVIDHGYLVHPVGPVCQHIFLVCILLRQPGRITRGQCLHGREWATLVSGPKPKRPHGGEDGHVRDNAREHSTLYVFVR